MERGTFTDADLDDGTLVTVKLIDTESEQIVFTSEATAK
ncbi:MAG: hypothetical protein MAG715_00172 [Methanonatronarchaeales archaeon]|nr:hypothetical protein [Methanonatronarchaeales archaeon]